MTTRTIQNKRALTRAVIAGIAILAISLSLTACSSDSKSTDASVAAASEPALDTAATADTSAVVDSAAAADSAAATASEVAAPAASDATSLFPVTIAAANGSVTIKAQPVAIISLSPTATETLYAIGAGSQVKAVDDQSNFPAESASKKSKLSGFEPNVEAIAAMKPDLVVISDDSKGLSTALGKLGIATLLGAPAKTIDDVYTQIEQLGAATGHVGDAAALVGQMQTDLSTTLASVVKTTAPVTFFHEVDKTGYTATSATFIGAIYKMLGLTNIADSVGDTTGYPQMSTEAIVTANPQIVFLSDALYGESAATVAARPGWSAVDAVKNNHIVALDSDVASRWGPRTVELVKAIAAAQTSVAAR